MAIEGGELGGMNRHFDRHTGRMAQIGLVQQVKLRMWPTPTAHNAQECASPSEFDRNTPTLAAQAAGGPLTQPMILNPEWVEWLQGWPMGWTDLKPLATASVQKWLHAHGGYSHD